MASDEIHPMISSKSDLTQSGVKGSADQSTQTPCSLTQLKSFNPNCSIDEKTYFLELSFADFNVLETFAKRKNDVSPSEGKISETGDDEPYQENLPDSPELHIDTANENQREMERNTVKKHHLSDIENTKEINFNEDEKLEMKETEASEDFIPLENHLEVVLIEGEIAEKELLLLDDTSPERPALVDPTLLPIKEESLEEMQTASINTPTNSIQFQTLPEPSKILGTNSTDAILNLNLISSEQEASERRETETTINPPILVVDATLMTKEDSLEEMQTEASSDISDRDLSNPILCLNIISLEQQAYEWRRRMDEVSRCRACQITFQTESAFQDHLKTHVFPVSLPSQAPFSVKNLKEQKYLSRKRSHRCHRCKRSFRLSHLLNKHRCIKGHKVRSHKKQLFTCTRCCVRFPLKSLLEEHLLKHADKEEAKSPQAGSESLFNRPLENDEVKSLQEMFPCPYCEKRFLNTDTWEIRLKAHLATHVPKTDLKVKKFQCGQCEKSYKLKSCLAGHYTKVHSGQGELGHKKSLGKGLRMHMGSENQRTNEDLIGMRQSDGGRKYVTKPPPNRESLEETNLYLCPVCGVNFHNMSNLEKHQCTNISGSENQRPNEGGEMKVETLDEKETEASDEIFLGSFLKVILVEGKIMEQEPQPMANALVTNRQSRNFCPIFPASSESLESDSSIPISRIKTFRSPYCLKRFHEMDNLTRKDKRFNRPDRVRFPSGLNFKTQTIAESYCQQCQDCQMKFRSEVDLQEHVEGVHLGLRPHICVGCEKRFARKEQLDGHACMMDSDR